MSFRSTDFKSVSATITTPRQALRPGRELHSRIALLQSAALLLGYLANFKFYLNFIPLSNVSEDEKEIYFFDFNCSKISSTAELAKSE